MKTEAEGATRKEEPRTETGPLRTKIARIRVGDLILALHQRLPAARAATKFRSLSHVELVQARHRVGTSAGDGGSRGIHGVGRHGLAVVVLRCER